MTWALGKRVAIFEVTTPVPDPMSMALEGGLLEGKVVRNVSPPSMATMPELWASRRLCSGPSFGRL